MDTPVAPRVRARRLTFSESRPSVAIEIDEIELLPFSSIIAEDLTWTAKSTLKPFVAAPHMRFESTVTRCCTGSSFISRQWTATMCDLYRRSPPWLYGLRRIKSGSGGSVSARSLCVQRGDRDPHVAMKLATLQ